MKNRRYWGIRTDGAKADKLEKLVHDVYIQIKRRPSNLKLLKKSFINLFTYLGSSQGRTDKNCQKVDLFFSIRDDWEMGIDHLPNEYQDLIEDIMCLHDTVSSPTIAENFGASPEQLLSRIYKIKINE